MRKIAPQLALAALMLAALAMPFVPARAALFGDDEARKAILDLRDSVAALDRQQRERFDALTKRVEDLENRVTALQHGQSEIANQHDSSMVEISKLRGITEQLANDLATTQKRERELYADLDQRLHRLEPSTITFDGRSGTVDREEQAAYDAAMSQFRARDFRSSINSLSGFVTRFPQSVYAPAAQFWLGSSYYAIKDYPAAVAAQRSLMERYPDSPRIPEALLNIAASQVELNDRKSARATLTRIANDYPNSEAAKLARERLVALAPTKEKK